MFATVVYAVLSTETGLLEYANAGHNLPLLYRAKTGMVEQLAKGGTALGVIKDLSITNHQVKIEKGDTLVFYTDGVTDMQSPSGEYFGEQRLRSTLQAHGGDSIQNQLEQLDDAMIEFRRGVPPSDDITLLAIRREPVRKRKPRPVSGTPGDL
jgi:sigma-B regulation protein RsbU (phosphoserine phosphatase)